MDFLSLQENNQVAIVGALAIIILVYYLSTKLRHGDKVKSPPQPPHAGGAWPIIGHLHLLGGPQLPHITLGTMAEKYGPIFTIRQGVHLIAVVSDSEVVKELFTKYDVAISSRPKFLAAQLLGHNYANFGFAPYGPYWSEMRKITSQELLSNGRMEQLKQVVVSETVTRVKELFKLWTTKRNDSGCVDVDMKQWFNDLTLNVVVRLVVGKRYFRADKDSGDEKEARKCQQIMRDFFRFLGLFFVSDNIPFLRFLDFGHTKAMKRVGVEMDNMMQKWMEEHRQNNEGQDFMAAIMNAVEKSALPDFDNDTIVKSTCSTIIAGGTDTSAVMLTWTLSLLLNNRNTLKRVQEELDMHVGRERQVVESDISKLVYLQAIVKETLRLYPAGPLGGLREFTQDCTVSNYHIPKGTRLLVNLWKLHRDERIWSNPMEFRPERFLDAHKDVDVKGRHFELIPFGAGRRLCPGVAYGIQILHLVLATLLHGFEISTVDNTSVDMTEIPGLTNCKATPLNVLLSPRLPSRLY
jgi:cytochrome P450